MKPILLAALIAGLFSPMLSPMFSQALPAREMRLLRYPAIHGDTVVFTYASDLWTADREGGSARRLTRLS